MIKTPGQINPEKCKLEMENSTIMKHQLNTVVAGIEPAGEDWARISVTAPEIAATVQPGQFVQVRAWKDAAPLLNRPFSVAGVSGDSLLLLIKKRGTATNILAALEPGSPITVIGPLGKNFSAPAGDRPVFLVAGGVGVAPMRFFIEKHSSEHAPRHSLFFGTRDSREIAILKDSLLDDADVVLTTEDGSAGEKGLVTEALAKRLEAASPEKIITCGPVPMMKAVAALAATKNIPCEVSMETYMGCGIGACMGCVVYATIPGKTFIHACVDGPVVDASIIDWSKI